MMRLNFATLSGPLQKTGGHRGTEGTASNHAASRRPPQPGNTGDMVGQASAPVIGKQAERVETSHLSHPGQNKVGRCKPSIHAAVPPVPPTKHMNEIDREAFEERAAIMEFDGGLSRAEAERLAAASLCREGRGAKKSRPEGCKTDPQPLEIR